MSAATSNFNEIPPNRLVDKVRPPYRSQIDAGRQLTTFDGWEAWGDEPDASMLAADAIYFWDQRVRAITPIDNSIPDLRAQKKFFAYASTKSLYFIGNEISIEGSLALAFDAPPPPPPAHNPQGAIVLADQPYAGAFVVANTIILDRALSGWKWGILDQSDVRQLPILTVSGARSAGVVFAARNFILGANARDLPQRVWSALGGDLTDTSPNGACPLTPRLLEFATKEIDATNLYLSEFYEASSGADCFTRALRAWARVFEYEISSRPVDILHRLVRVDLNGFNQAPYATTSLVEAQGFVGQRLLVDWNVAAADRLLLQVQSADLQDDRDGLGRALRDAEALRSRFLAQPTASSAQRLSSTFAAIGAVKAAKAGTRIVARGSDFAEAAALAGSLLLESATSKETWLIPDRLNVLPLTGDASMPRFARVWVNEQALASQQNVNLQLLAAMGLTSQAEAQASKALTSRGLQYSGVALELEFTGLRQSHSSDWSFENVTQISDNRFIINLRTSKSYYDVLKQQISHPPGLPIEVDWRSLRDHKISSSEYGPIRTTLGLFSLPWQPVPVNNGVIRNDSSFPIDITGGDGPAGHTAIDPPERIPSAGNVTIPALAKIQANEADTVIDAIGDMPVQDKLELVSPESALLTVKFFNLRDSQDGRQVKNLSLNVTILDQGGKVIQGPFQIGLARFGLPEASRAISLLLPPNFRIRYAGQWEYSDNTTAALPTGEADGVEVRIN